MRLRGRLPLGRAPGGVRVQAVHERGLPVPLRADGGRAGCSIPINDMELPSRWGGCASSRRDLARLESLAFEHAPQRSMASCHSLP